MTTVCFTGEGATPDGTKWLRSHWEDFATAANILVSKNIKYGVILVSSRMDTKKAKAAAASGNRIMTYEEFYNTYVDKAKGRFVEERAVPKSRDYSGIDMFGAF